MATLSAQDIIEREKAKALIKAAQEMARSTSLIKYFEEYGCSCHPFREELKRLIEERDREVREQFKRSYLHHLMTEKGEADWTQLIASGSQNSYSVQLFGPKGLYQEMLSMHPHTAKIVELQQGIQKKDRDEHGRLNVMAREASTFFHIWLLERGLEELSQGSEALGETYTKAWLGGWRPGAKVAQVAEG